MVSCGFGTRAKLMPSRIEYRDRPVLARTLLFDDGLEDLDRRAERNVVEHLAVAKHRHLDRHDQLLLHRADEQVGILRAFGREHLFHDVAVVAQRAGLRCPGSPRKTTGGRRGPPPARRRPCHIARGSPRRCGEIFRNRRCAARWSAPAPAARRSCAEPRHRARGGCCARFRARAARRPCGPVRSR